MKNQIKIILVLVGMFAFGANSFGQVIKCKATSIAFKEYNEYSERWSDWSDWEDVNILITFDVDNDRIKIFSKEDQIYDIINDLGESTDSDGDVTYKWLCVNENGLKCHVRLIKLNSKGGKNQIYVSFNDISWVYNIYMLD